MNIKAAKKLSIDAKEISINADTKLDMESKILKIDTNLANISATLMNIKSKIILRGILIVTGLIYGRVIRKIPFIGF